MELLEKIGGSLKLTATRVDSVDLTKKRTHEIGSRKRREIRGERMGDGAD